MLHAQLLAALPDDVSERVKLIDEALKSAPLNASYRLFGPEGRGQLVVRVKSLLGFMATEVALAHEAEAELRHCQRCGDLYFVGHLTGTPCDRTLLQRFLVQCRRFGRASRTTRGRRMSIRKRTWTTARGVEKEAWIVDYADGNGARRLKTFSRKKEADLSPRPQRSRSGKASTSPTAPASASARPRSFWISRRGRKPGTLHDQPAPAPPEVSHRSVYRRHPAVEADRSVRARFRGQASPGRPFARDAAQGSWLARIDPDRRPGARTASATRSRTFAAPAARARSARRRSARRASSWSARTFRPATR